MFQVGLKVWSTNRNYVDPARRLFEAGAFDYVEMTVPGESTLEDVALWSGEPYPFVLHAPHAYCGLNMSVRALEEDNRAQIEKLSRAQSMLRPKHIIFHAGVGGDLAESIRQLAAFRKAYPELFADALLENNPRVGLADEVCLGSSPDEIREVTGAVGLGFCLDLAHAIHYANWARHPWQDAVREFMGMGPVMFHLSDGEAAAVKDSHEHLGEGSIDLREVLAMIPGGAMVTLETRKDSSESLDDFLPDVNYVNEGKP